MNAAAPKSPGLKRICTSCGARFYDLNKRPIICPACNTEFTGDIKVKSRRGRLPADVKKGEILEEENVVETEDEILEDEDGIEVVSLDDAEVEEEADSDEDDVMDLGDDLGDLDGFEDDLDDIDEDDALLEDED